jgi:hypothetical protein
VGIAVAGEHSRRDRPVGGLLMRFVDPRNEATLSLPLMGRGRGGVLVGVERRSAVTPTLPSPIQGEGCRGGLPE